jgi:hypothetical protein
MRTAADQLAHITQTVEVSLPEGGLLALLEQDRPLRIKLGVDPIAGGIDQVRHYQLGFQVFVGTEPFGKA